MALTVVRRRTVGISVFVVQANVAAPQLSVRIHLRGF